MGQRVADFYLDNDTLVLTDEDGKTTRYEGIKVTNITDQTMDVEVPGILSMTVHFKKRRQ